MIVSVALHCSWTSLTTKAIQLKVQLPTKLHRTVKHLRSSVLYAAWHSPCTGCGYMDLLSAHRSFQLHSWVQWMCICFWQKLTWKHLPGTWRWAGWAGMKVQLGLALETTLSCLRAIRRYSVASGHARSPGSWAEVREISKGFSEVALKFSRSSEATKCDFDIENKWSVIRVQLSAFLYPVQIQSHPHTTMLQATRWGRADQPSNLSMFCLFFEVGPECPGKKRASRPPYKGIWSTLFNFEVVKEDGSEWPDRTNFQPEHIAK